MAEGEGVDLSKKVGPLPIGVWIGVAVAGLAIGYFINSRQKSSGPTEEQLTESGVGTGGGTFLPINPPSESDEEETPENNFTWQGKAVTWLIAQGINGVVATNAVSKYLNGQTLSEQEQNAISLVLQKYGPPPDGVSPPPDNPIPAKPSNLVLTGTVGGTVMLSWTPVANATSYEVRWSSQFGEGGPRTTVLPTISSQGHDNRYDHVFYVRAVNDFGASDSASISVPKWSGSSANPPSSPPTNPPPSSPPPSSSKQYTVRRGDTLTGISSQMYGTGSRWLNIYNANMGTIEDVARRHGKSSSRGPNGTVGWWIYEGTVLVIP